MPRITSICLIAARRTGSNMLMSMFPPAHCVDLGEVFNLNNLRVAGFEQQSDDLETVQQKRCADRAAFLLSHVHRPEIYGGRIPVWKYQYGNFARCGSEPWQARLVETVKALEGVGFIHLSRRDLVARHVSLQRAKATGEFLLRDGATARDAAARIHIPPGQCLRDIQRVTEMAALAERLFGGARAFLRLSYEEILADPAAVAARIRTAFAVDFDLTPPTTTRQGRPLAETVANYPALHDRLRDTPWAEFVPPPPAAGPGMPG